MASAAPSGSAAPTPPGPARTGSERGAAAPPTPLFTPLQPFRALGRALVVNLAGAGRVVSFSTAAAWATLRSRAGWQATAEQGLLLSARCLVPVVLVLAPIGALLALQCLVLVRSFGVERHVAALIAATIIREIAPGFSAVVIAMQGGAGIAAELSSMRHNEELDALDVMGLDGRAWIAGPRILGAIVAAPLLNAVAIAVALFGAWLVAVPLMGMPHGLFREDLVTGLSAKDLWVSEGKTVLFGALIGGVAAVAGWFAGPGPQGIGRAANRAVVSGIVLVLLFNYLLNTMNFGLVGTG